MNVPARLSNRCKSLMVNSSKLSPLAERRPPVLGRRSARAGSRSPTPSPRPGMYSPRRVLRLRSILPDPKPDASPPAELTRRARLSGRVCSRIKALNSCGASSGWRDAGSQKRSWEECAAAAPSWGGEYCEERGGEARGTRGTGRGWSEGSRVGGTEEEMRRVRVPVSAAVGAVGDLGEWECSVGGLRGGVAVWMWRVGRVGMGKSGSREVGWERDLRRSESRDSICGHSTSVCDGAEGAGRVDHLLQREVRWG